MSTGISSSSSSSATAAAADSVPAKASTLKSPGSVAFSSQPVAPVVVNSHARRQTSDAGPSWPPKSATAAAATASGSTAASAGTTPPPPTDGDNNNSNNSSSANRAMRHPQQQQQRSSVSSGPPPRTAAPPSPYNSSDDGSETSEDERVSNKTKSVSASVGKDSSSSSSSGQQQQARQSGGSGSSSVASMSLPSISGAALLQLRGGGGGGGSTQSMERMNSIQPAEKHGDEQYEGSAGSGRSASRHYRRSRSRSRERPEANNTGRWASSSNSVNEEASGGTDKDVVMSSGRPEDRSSFSGSSDDRELRIMFHGREIYADDLIGLRVAKTFVGHGRFLGQVVKFDEPTSLYTVVYADGDAEELNIDNTIQILIQDEIERADPSLPPVASAYAKEVYSSRPESPEITGAKGPSASNPYQQQQQQRSSSQVSSSSGANPGPPEVIPSSSTLPPPPQAAVVAAPRAALQISEREAAFVVGLFENHALPVLAREGWKIQTSPSGTEQRFYAPPGNFPGAGRVFTSALAVVELIGSDNELLSACFPQNVHSAILSLFPESSRLRESSHGQQQHTRKRVPAAQVEAEPYDMKRQRPGREEMGGDRPATSHMRPVPSSRGPPPPQPPSQRHSEPRGYHHSEDIVMEREREGYASDRVPPVSADRFSVGSSSSRDGGSRSGSVRPGGHPDSVGEYRRAPPPSDGRGAPPHRGGPPSHESAGPRWPGSGGGVRSSSAASDLVEYRRHYADSPEWREREMHSRGGPPHYSSGPPPSSYHEEGHFRNHSRTEDPSYYADRSRSGMRAAPVGSDGPPGSYRYQDGSGSPVRRSSSAEHFHRHASGRSGGAPSAVSDNPSSSPSGSRRDSGPPEYRNVSASDERMTRGGPTPPGRGGDGASMAPTPPPSAGGAPGRGPSFSMVDVDRNPVPRASVPSSASSLMEHARTLSSESGPSSKWENRRPPSEHSGYDQPNERGRSPHMNEQPSQSYGGSSQHHQHQHHRHQQQSHHHRHHQQMPSNGGGESSSSSSYMDVNGSGGRGAPSADSTQEQQQRSTVSPGSSGGAAAPGSKRAGSVQ